MRKPDHLASTMNEIRFDYDPEGDVMHVSLGTGEPSFSEEIDDHLVVDIGIYSGAPTGFQLLHVKGVGIGKLQVTVNRAMKAARKRAGAANAVAAEREHLIEKALRDLPGKARETLAFA